MSFLSCFLSVPSLVYPIYCLLIVVVVDLLLLYSSSPFLFCSTYSLLHHSYSYFLSFITASVLVSYIFKLVSLPFISVTTPHSDMMLCDALPLTASWLIIHNTPPQAVCPLVSNSLIAPLNSQASPSISVLLVCNAFLEVVTEFYVFFSTEWFGKTVCRHLIRRYVE